MYKVSRSCLLSSAIRIEYEIVKTREYMILKSCNITSFVWKDIFVVFLKGSRTYLTISLTYLIKTNKHQKCFLVMEIMPTIVLLVLKKRSCLKQSVCS